MRPRVHNILTKRKEEFIPREAGSICMYVCGPTVYNYIHIGNARCYVAFDAIYRYLKYRGYKVTYVRNLTDIDDKIINRAREEKTTSENIAEKYTRAFWEDMKRLSVEKPQFEPKATEVIPEMIQMIEVLMEKGYAYEVDGDVFFEVTKFPGYGKLSGRTLEEMRAGERVEVDERKRHPMDFALWKRAKLGEPKWPSPWGEGRPGWHIECSAMSLKFLGMGFDIHGGGQDLIFPHHENEIAQSEAYAGSEPFVRYWLHNGFVNVRGEKMAKSVGNVILVKELFNKYNPNVLRNALRILFLSTHYRSPIDFSEGSLAEAIEALGRLETAFLNLEHTLEMTTTATTDSAEEEALSEALLTARKKFGKSMDDDFNTASALGAIFEFAREINIFLDRGLKGESPLKEAKTVLGELTDVLGIKLGLTASPETLLLPEQLKRLSEKLSSLLTEFSVPTGEGILPMENISVMVEALLMFRGNLRRERRWREADGIRTALSTLGVEVDDVDTPKGYRWRLNLQACLSADRRSPSEETSAEVHGYH
ncbi:MAG TPA: cysteine--tRNA ligase [Actinobacteria bacterium]|nr:cysteine--tRNA ligase [Actinomycetota bacterium]